MWADMMKPKSKAKDDKKSSAHPGFKGAMQQVENREGVSPDSAARIIGANKANASAAARKANPRLNKTR